MGHGSLFMCVGGTSAGIHSLAVPFVITAAVVFLVTSKFSIESNKMGRDTHHINVYRNYKSELQEKFCDIHFFCLQKTEGVYITNPENKNIHNDFRIFKETQVKRVLRSWISLLVPQAVKNKLSYFYQEEDKNESKIYKHDDIRSLQSEEEYAIQNIGHATLLIQIPGFNILIDPVYYDLNNVFYPAKTASHKSIQELPKIDVIVISHNHSDHVDQRSLQDLLRYHQQKNWPEPKVFVAMGDKRLMENFGFSQVEEVEWYTKISVTNEMEKTVNFVSIPADHRSGRYVFDHHKSLVTGWVINPEHEDVIFKYSGDTRALTDETQQATDAVLWNEIKCKKLNQNVRNIKIPNIICFEPSGPNYTRCDMDITHQSTSYSALLKFIETENLSRFSMKSSKEFIQKIQTVMIHHNKFELGPDRFNEGLFVFKKLLKYLDLSDRDLDQEVARQKEKLESNLDKIKLKDNVSCAARPFIATLLYLTLAKQTSLLVHAKDFIIEEIKEVTSKLGNTDQNIYLKQYLLKNTVFPKIGERLNNVQVESSTFNIESVQKYNGKRICDQSKEKS